MSMLIVAIVMVLLAILIVRKTVKSVSQGSEYIIERFGRYRCTLSPGLNFIIPIIDKVANVVSMKETVLNIRQQEVISKDNASVSVDGIAFFQIMDSKQATYIINNLPLALENLIMTNIRTVLGSMSLDEMLSNRETMNNRLLSVVDEATQPWGVKVLRIEIKDITPPRDLLEAMTKQMKAERDKRAEILTAEGIKQAAILKAEGNKQSAILEAEGQKQAQFNQAEARIRLAEAEAEATKKVSDAIKDGDIKAIQYFIAQGYVKALGDIASSGNSKTVMIPLEASSIMGSVGGIAELLKSTNINNEK